jgi:hypothetical protein
MPTRVISFAGTTLAVEYQGDRPAKIVAFLYRHFAAGSRDAPQVIYRLVSSQGAEKIDLYRNDELLIRSNDEAAVADFLLGNSCYQLAYHSQGGLLFHAAGLTHRGRGLILPGTMGAGKSTLTAWLLTKDFDYLTDEMVFIPAGTVQIQPLTRPLNLKRPARKVLADQCNIYHQAGPFYASATTDLVPPTLLRPDNRFSEPPLRLIIFPRYQAGAAFKLQALSKAQAGLALMECLVNARNLPEHGFPRVIRLARRIPAYKMTYAGFDQIDGRIEALLESIPTT